MTIQETKAAIAALRDHPMAYLVMQSPFHNDEGGVSAPSLKELVTDHSRLEAESEWVRTKLGIAPDAPISDLQGCLHQVYFDHRAYRNYIAAGKCDDKQAEIARLEAENQRLRAAFQRLYDDENMSCGIRNYSQAALAENGGEQDG